MLIQVFHFSNTIIIHSVQQTKARIFEQHFKSNMNNSASTHPSISFVFDSSTFSKAFNIIIKFRTRPFYTNQIYGLPLLIIFKSGKHKPIQNHFSRIHDDVSRDCMIVLGNVTGKRIKPGKSK